MAVSVAAARDMTKKFTAVEVPLCLAENAVGGLTGGLKLNWDTDKKKTTLGVFVDVPFTVWSRLGTADTRDAATNGRSSRQLAACKRAVANGRI